MRDQRSVGEIASSPFGAPSIVLLPTYVRMPCAVSPAASADALLLFVAVLRMQPAVFGIGPRQKAAMVAVKTKENTMQVISLTDLSRLTRAQLFSLLTQFQATLADLVPGTPEHQFATAMLANVRLALCRKAPSP